MHLLFHFAQVTAATEKPADYTAAYITGICALVAALIAVISLWMSDRRKLKGDFQGKAHPTVTASYNDILKSLDPFYKTQDFGKGDRRHITALHPAMQQSLATMSGHVSALGIISSRCKKAAQRVHDVCAEVYDSSVDEPMTAEQTRRLKKAKLQLERATRRYLKAA